MIGGGDAELAELIDGLSFEALVNLVDGLPDGVVAELLDQTATATQRPPDSPVEQALELDEGYVLRDHLTYLSDRLAAATADVKAGRNRKLVVSMPPRSGKSQLVSVYLPLYLLRQNPHWTIGSISHDYGLAVGWARAVRQIIEEHGPKLSLSIAPDGGAAGDWHTPEGGGVTARSAPGQSITGRGFNVLLLDDITKDFAAAHSETNRRAIWEWWTANAYTRLEAPYLVVAVATRWHEDDFIGRLLSDEYDGDPDEWEVISFPAIAESADALGRAPGAPLISPIVRDESPDDALERWDGIRKSVGSYAWASLYQQRPAPAAGAVFDVGWWRYWTDDPELATDDGSVVYIDPDSMLDTFWLDSWDLTFSGGENSDYVVGQRWLRHNANRYLMDQRRGKWSFTQTLAQMEDFALARYGQHVHLRLVEKKANGAAILDTLHDRIPGLKAVTPTASKEVRARAVTPEIESGNVYLPLPAENPWVTDLLSELRAFPSGAHDDQVDTLSQALAELRSRTPAVLHAPAPRAATRTPSFRTALRGGRR